MRYDEREKDQLRPVTITPDYLMHADGSVLIEMGKTKVICTACVEEKTAQHLRGTGKGWVTAEYAMLPASTGVRKQRDIIKGKLDGRSQEIQRLIGRALRSVVQLEKLGERTIWIDCDVIQADGGTRTASITGAFVAMILAMKKLKEKGLIRELPVTASVSAVSVGIVDGEAMLDLCYVEDSKAHVDMNVVMTGEGEYIELQGTGEEAPFSRDQMNQLLALADKGCRELCEKQREMTGDFA